MREAKAAESVPVRPYIEDEDSVAEPNAVAGPQGFRTAVGQERGGLAVGSLSPVKPH
jgi:hypothetical protein